MQMFPFLRSGVVIQAVDTIEDEAGLRPNEKRAIAKLAEAVRRNPKDARLDPSHEGFRNFVVEAVMAGSDPLGEQWAWRALGKLNDFRIAELPGKITHGEIDLTVPPPTDPWIETRKVLAARAGGQP